VLAGALDVNSPPPAMAELATLFPLARVVIQPGAGHYPWADDPDRFVATLATFLR
jgi:proline iminopeptidase